MREFGLDSLSSTQVSRAAHPASRSDHLPAPRRPPRKGTSGRDRARCGRALGHRHRPSARMGAAGPWASPSPCRRPSCIGGPFRRTFGPAECAGPSPSSPTVRRDGPSVRGPLRTPGCGAARRAVPGGATWLRCRSSGKLSTGEFPDPPHHLARIALHHAPSLKTRKRIGAGLREVWNAGSLARAESVLEELVADDRDTAPALAAWLEEAVPEGLAVFSLPGLHRRRLPHLQPHRADRPAEAQTPHGQGEGPSERGVTRAPRQRRGGRHRRQTGRREGLHQTGMPGGVISASRNFQTWG